jgi:hypothetical protein
MSPIMEPHFGGSETTSSEGGEWLDVEPEEEAPAMVISLFDDDLFADARSMLGHCKAKYGFDFIDTCRGLSLDFHGSVRLINFSKLSPILTFSASGLSLIKFVTVSVTDDKFHNPFRAPTSRMSDF